MRKITLAMLPILAVTAGSGLAGTVSGTVPLPARPAGRIAMEKYSGTISGKVGAPPPPCAGVWIEGPGVKAAAGPKIVLGQQGYQFQRSLLVVTPGTSVEFPNNDNDYHNIYSLSRPKRFDAGRYKKNEAPPPIVTFDKTGFIRVRCEIHDHMNAAVLVVDSPWHTVTDSKGKFTLSGIPAGSYTVRAQFDEKTQWSAPVSITSDRPVAVDFSKPAVIP